MSKVILSIIYWDGRNMMSLKLAGLVVSHQGGAGGFSLARDPETISIADVLHAVEGRVTVAPCGDPQACDRASGCPTRGVKAFIFWTNSSREPLCRFGATRG